MPVVEIYTDGACVPNPGPGGWGAVLRYGSKEKDLCGGTAEQRNQLTVPIWITKNNLKLTLQIGPLKVT